MKEYYQHKSVKEHYQHISKLYKADACSMHVMQMEGNTCAIHVGHKDITHKEIKTVELP